MDEDIIRVRLRAPSKDALRAFAKATDADLGCRPIARRSGDDYVCDAYLPESTMARAAAVRSDVRVERIENFSETSRQRRAEVSSGDRYRVRGAAVPRGYGRKE
jgi:hypothetical protein